MIVNMQSQLFELIDELNDTMQEIKSELQYMNEHLMDIPDISREISNLADVMGRN